MSTPHSYALKVATLLWIVWGLVHMIAGILTISGDATAGVQGIADAVDPALLEADYHPAVGGLFNQHGWNLAWGGLVTVIGAIFIWRGNKTAIWVTAMVGGLLDLGYFLYMDLPGYVHFVPGTLMTLISGSAILLTAWVYFTHKWDA